MNIGRATLGCWLACALSLPGTPVRAEPDDAQQAWLEAVDVAPFWDNVREDLAWVGGQRPQRRAGETLHSVRLQPGAQVTVRLPAGEALRLNALNGPVVADGLEVAWSNGTGLFAALVPVASDDGHALIVRPPRTAEALLRVRSKPDAASPLEYVLFVSRDPNREVATSYRELLTPVAAGPRRRLDDGAGRRDFWLTDREHPLQLDYTGPTRLRVDTRLMYPAAGGPYAESYRLAVYRNDVLVRIVDLATMLETHRAIAVDGCERPIGRPAFAYLDLPAGSGRLEIRVRRPMLLRVLAERPQGDYLIAANAPVAAPPPTRSDAQVYRDVVRIARNNAHPMGGIGASTTLDALARLHPVQGQYQTLAARRRALHTFYRDLSPRRETLDDPPLFAWFRTPRLTRETGPTFLPEAYVPGLAGGLASGFFHAVPRQVGRAQTFAIPEQLPSGELRIAVDLGGVAGARILYLQMDDAPPLPLHLDAHHRLLRGDLRPNTAALALDLLRQREGAAGVTLSGAFASRHRAAPLVDVAFVEIPLTQPVQRLKLWRADAADGPLRAALAYRTSGWFKQSEAGYLDLLDALGETRARSEIRHMLAGLVDHADVPVRLDAAPGRDDAERELRNQWLPLLRFLQSRYTQFAASVDPSVSPATASSPADQATVGAAVQRARAADGEGDWHEALRQWSWVQRKAPGPLRLEARARQVHALQMLGNDFLARQLLRYDLLSAKDSALREQALHTLVERAELAQDAEAVTTVLAVAAISDPTAGRLQALGEALAETGHARFALQLMLALPATRRPAPAVLEAAYDLGWWRLFDATLAGVDDPRRRALWRGYHRQLEGDLDAAMTHWQAAGPRGRRLAERLARGVAIRQALGSPRAEERQRALLDWEEWQAGDDEPQSWRDAADSVRSHAGMRTVATVARGEFQHLFRAMPQQPLRLGVYGPTRLRFTARPLHDAAADHPIDDWVLVGSAHGESRHPIVDNTVSAGLRLTADDGHYPGRGVEILYQVPAGYQELVLNATHHELLVAVAAEGPRRPLAVLPRLSPYTAQQALAGAHSPVTPLGSRTPAAVDVRLIGACDVRRVTLDAAATSAMPGQRVGVPAATWFEETNARRTGRPSQASAAAAEPALVERLSALLWEAEQAPQRHAALLAQAEQLAAEQPGVPAAAAILRRLRRTASWEPLRTVQDSAGVRMVDFRGWQPESPALQVRKAVMGLDTADDQLMSGHAERVLSLYNLRPVTIALRLSLVEAALQPVQPMRVLVSWDDQAPSAVELDAATPELSLAQDVGGGHHVLRLRIAEPLANQFLRVRLEERRGNGSRVIGEPVQRSYMLATREQPLVLLARGPTRLRIDEWRDGRTRRAYRDLDEGWQRVVIAVEDGRDEALLRVFRRTVDPGQPTTALRRAAHDAPVLQAPLWPQLPTVDLTEAAVSEPPANGWPGTGTWSLNFGLTRRHAVEDEPRTGGDAERFATLGAGYRRFSDVQNTYYRAETAVRLHEEGDPTLALRGLMNVRKPHWPLDLDVSGSLFLQHVDATGGVESAATLRARISRHQRLGEKVSHRPSLTFFQRWLSLDALPQGGSVNVDQDVFTPYKRDHSRGLRVGERIHYRPWLDTLLYAGGQLVSNEDLNLADPDHVSFSIGARQLFGDLDLGVRYRRFEYFADDDRDHRSDAQRLRLDTVFSRWFSPRRGLRAGLAYEYDYDSNDSSVFLLLSLEQANGRYYRDYPPSELSFRGLRQRKTLERHVREGWQ